MEFITENLIPKEVMEKSNEATGQLIPKKSSGRYEKEFDLFNQWKQDNKVASINEDIVMAYLYDLFVLQSKKYKSSSLWSKFSMVKSMLLVNENINIAEYAKVRAFLKKQSVGYEPSKSKVLSREEIDRFMSEAPNKEYLMMKVVAMLGITGGCRREELHSITLQDIQDTGTQLVVTIPQTKTNHRRVFTVIDERGQTFLQLYREYLALRPKNVNYQFIFLGYRKGCCISQRVGIHTIGGVPKKIAEFLGLPDPAKYTGHCFRSTSATLLANAGADLSVLKRHGGWKSSSVAEKYIEDSIEGKNRISKMIQNGENFVEVLNHNTSTTINKNSNINNSFKIPTININHNENSTININFSVPM